jgi:hypothetical protein
MIWNDWRLAELLEGKGYWNKKALLVNGVSFLGGKLPILITPTRKPKVTTFAMSALNASFSSSLTFLPSMAFAPGGAPNIFRSAIYQHWGLNFSMIRKVYTTFLMKNDVEWLKLEPRTLLSGKIGKINEIVYEKHVRGVWLSALKRRGRGGSGHRREVSRWS